MIPLRPELFSFTDPKSLCRLTCTSKTLHKDVRESNAWARLSEAQLPPARPRDAASDALSRVRSQTIRRRLADALSQETPQPQMRLNRFEDFTYFVRLEEDGVIIWEGDLTQHIHTPYGHSISLLGAWYSIQDSEPWEGMEDFLTTPTDDDEFEGYLRSVGITVVAIRNDDQAMVSLGHFRFHEAIGSVGATEQEYAFKSRQPLFSSERFELTPLAVLRVTHDEWGVGTLDALELRLEHYSPEAVYHPHNADGFVEPPGSGECYFQFRYLLSYLAGTHHRSREQALATIKQWHAKAASVLGDSWPNYESDGTIEGDSERYSE